MANKTSVEVREQGEPYAQQIQTRQHIFAADEPESVGGTDTGPTPYELLLGALGSCTTITVRMYANRKKWPLESVNVSLNIYKIHARDCEDCEQESGMVDIIEKQIVFQGDLTTEQRERLLDISQRCPVHKTLSGGTKIRSVLA